VPSKEPEKIKSQKNNEKKKINPHPLVCKEKENKMVPKKGQKNRGKKSKS
jgi:hypothetical protein